LARREPCHPAQIRMDLLDADVSGHGSLLR